MPQEYVDFTTGDTSGQGNPATPESLAAWINGAKARLSAGQSLTPGDAWDPAHGHFGLPLGYKVENGQLVQDTHLWESVYKGLLGTAGMATLGLLVGPTMAASGPTLEASMNAGVGATTAANAPAAGSIPAAFGNTAVDTITSGPAASSVPSWVRPAITAAAPFAINAATGGGSSSNGSGANGLNPEQNDLLTQLIRMSMQRQQETAPVHQAAMALAGKLAPTGSWGDSPRFGQAVQQTTGPGPQSTANPQVTAAMQRLMNGGR
jgi:hypothetical protein